MKESMECPQMKPSDINLDPTCSSRPAAKIMASADIYIFDHVYLKISSSAKASHLWNWRARGKSPLTEHSSSSTDSFGDGLSSSLTALMKNHKKRRKPPLKLYLPLLNVREHF